MGHGADDGVLVSSYTSASVLSGQRARASSTACAAAITAAFRASSASAQNTEDLPVTVSKV